MTPRNRTVLMTLLAVVALTLGACSESTTPEDVAGDTTAPQITGTTPANGQINVASYATISASFNEAMDPASAIGQVTLSSGGAATVTWLTDRAFTVACADGWAEGVQVTVTLGSGLRDVAGNALAAPYTFSFFVETSELLLLATEPANAATDVSRSANVRLQFSYPVDEASAAAGVTIADAVTKAVYPFTVSGSGSNSWITLDPTGNLPTAAMLTVTVGATVHVAGSPANTLGEAAAFHFTTGADVDTTPPTIVSLSPANGATNVAADIGALSITFSEPINPVGFEPSAFNIEFYLILMAGNTQPVWSQDNTVLTIALPVLPAGLEMEVTLGGYADPSGNVQNTQTVWSARVAGTADIFPMADGIRHYLSGDWSRGLAGSAVPTESGFRQEYRQVEVQANDDVHVVGYNDDTFTTPRRWDVYDRLASTIDWLGFADGGDGDTPQAILFDTPVKFLPLPVAIGTWSANTTVTVPGEGVYTAVMTGHVIAREDLPLEDSRDGTSYYYKDAWKVARSLEVTLGGEWFVTMSDTTWYSPTLGPVREISHEDSAAAGADPAGWYRTELWRDPTNEESGK